ncbi:Dyp-type peroxidase [Spongiibacter tropicus]|uniref:Dyp-type peroxidase n=1 Tax=Spongiibacter tropicus TaxID=454602 RepID=UPI0035BE46CF
MSLPQPGIFVEGSRRHMFMEYQFNADADSALARAALGRAMGALQALDGRQLNVVWAFGKESWERLGGRSPAGFKAFSPVGSGAVMAPATQHGLLLWLHGDDEGALFDAAITVDTLLKEIAEVALEIRGFMYHDARDLSGFIDGTENPDGEERKQVALIPEGEIGAGGSFVLSQKWIHRLESFRTLSQSEQEGVIGRTKPDSVELDDDVMPENSHVSRSDVKINGQSQKLFRRSVPFGGVREHGLYFLSFSAELSRYEHILASMFGKAEDGIVDRLTDFSTPVSGSFWFAPSATELSEWMTH